MSTYFPTLCNWSIAEKRIYSPSKHFASRTDKGRKFDPADVVIDVLPDNPRALDIGSGAGNLLGTMKKLGMETVGIDPDPKARAEAERNGHSVYPGTAESIPAELLSKRFDLVTMTHVLEHCLDPLKAMVAARSVLAEQGYFYCEVPNAGE